jgi:hypothetical protein
MQVVVDLRRGRRASALERVLEWIINASAVDSSPNSRASFSISSRSSLVSNAGARVVFIFLSRKIYLATVMRRSRSHPACLTPVSRTGKRFPKFLRAPGGAIFSSRMASTPILCRTSLAQALALPLGAKAAGSESLTPDFACITRSEPQRLRHVRRAIGVTRP